MLHPINLYFNSFYTIIYVKKEGGYNMFNKEKFFDEFCNDDFRYDYNGNMYEVVDVKNSYVILQNLNDDSYVKVSLHEWDNFHNKYLVKEEPLSESFDDLTNNEFNLMQQLY